MQNHVKYIRMRFPSLFLDFPLNFDTSLFVDQISQSEIKALSLS